MKIGILSFPDYDCGENLYKVFNSVLNIQAEQIRHTVNNLKGYDTIFVNGGTLWLSYTKEYGHVSPLIEALFDFSEKGRFIFGFGEGFRLLTKMKLLPGEFKANKEQRNISKNIFIRVDNSNSALTTLVDKTSCIKLPLTCADGCYHASEQELMQMRQNEQILFRYCDENAEISKKNNATGSIDSIAAVCDINKRVFGMQPNPEYAVDENMGNIQGMLI